MPKQKQTEQPEEPQEEPQEEPPEATPKSSKKKRSQEKPEEEEPPSAPRKSKKSKTPAEEPAEEEPAEEEGEEEEGEDGEEEEGEDGEEEGEEEAEEEAGEEEDPRKVARREKARRKARMKKAEKVRNNGWRKIATSVGFVDSDGSVSLASGVDGLRCLLSPADAKRLMTFVPATPGADSFSSEEFQERTKLFLQGVPLSAANETQVRCDAIQRAVMNAAVIRALEMGKVRISPSVMRSVLRPFSGKTKFTSIVAPDGLVQHAIKQGIVSATQEDTSSKVKRARVAEENARFFTEAVKIKESGKRQKSTA